MTPVRLAAARVLMAVDQGRATLATELERARAGIDAARDKGLLIEIATGTLRWRNELDALIARASGRPLRDVDARALAVLRLGAYQLRHLDRVPAHAAVHESVEVVRALGAPRAAGFVNAVLRRLLRQHGARLLPARPPPGATVAHCLAYLSVTLSHPEWLVARWLDRYGFESTERWCQFNNTAPETTVRPLGTLSAADLITRLQAEGIDATPAPYAPDAIRLVPGALGRMPVELRDQILVQDEASQLVARFVGARPGDRVLDLCAAPGGKTVVMASSSGPGDRPPLIIAGDRRPKRLALLKDTLDRAGLAGRIVALNALAPLPFSDVFDRVLLDVPCSGLGTLRREPDLKWSRREEDLARLSSDALRMLDHAAAVVRPGGVLVYATCSSEPEENAGVVDAFLTTNGLFTRATPGDEFNPAAGSLLDDRGCLVTSSPRHGLEAFFAALLVRRQGA